MLDSLWSPDAAPIQFRSDDLDEIREHMDRHNGAHWRHARRPGPLGFRLAVEPRGPLRYAWCAIGGNQTVRGAVALPTAHVTLAGWSQYRVGRRTLEAGPGDVVLLPSGRDLTFEAEGLRRFAIELPPGLVDGARVVGALRFRPGEAPLAGLRGALEALRRAAGHEPALRHAGARLSECVRALLPAVPEGRREPRLARDRVRRIEEWIDAHVQEPITLATLCERAGVRARCLQIAFESRRQQSPMAFVAERRLAAAHAALSRGEFGSVTAAAAAFGFEHPGRFAAAFRRLYGLAPAQMLRKSHARD